MGKGWAICSCAVNFNTSRKTNDKISWITDIWPVSSMDRTNITSDLVEGAQIADVITTRLLCGNRVEGGARKLANLTDAGNMWTVPSVCIKVYLLVLWLNDYHDNTMIVIIRSNRTRTCIKVCRFMIIKTYALILGNSWNSVSILGVLAFVLRSVF